MTRATNKEFSLLLGGELSEKEICINLVDSLKKAGFEFFTHINNEQFTKSWKIKRENKDMGVSPGVPDYLIILPMKFTGLENNKLIFIEMKTAEGRVRPNQKAWLEALGLCVGVDTYVARSEQEALNIINKYWKIGLTKNGTKK